MITSRQSALQPATQSLPQQAAKDDGHRPLLDDTQSQACWDDKQQQVTLSTWKVGWRVATLMVTCYVLAILVSVSHVILFLYLDGKLADGPGRVAPQSYISTSSYILASTFQYSLKTALGVAFTQHLWYVLRRKTIKVWTIETLFSLRSNPLALFEPAAIRGFPVLLLLALLIWALVVITSFPPGAITIVSEIRTINGSATVSTFNSSFMGNGSGFDAATYSLDILFGGGTGPDMNSSNQDYVTSASLYDGIFEPVLERLGVGVLIGGQPVELTSPCGPNCSYSVSFEGPYLQCDNSTSTISFMTDNNDMINIYNGSYLQPSSTDTTVDTSSEFTGASFNIITLFPIAIHNQSESNSIILATQQNLTCIPFRATYTMENTFQNGIHSFNVSAHPIQRIVRFSVYDDNPYYPSRSVHVPGFSDPSQIGMLSYGSTPANWSETALNWYRDLNLINIIDVVASSLAGNYAAMWYSDAENAGQSPSETMVGYGDILWYKDLIWVDQVVPGMTGPLNETIIQYTKLNTAHAKRRSLFNMTNIPSISFDVTSDLLNSALLNVTISLITSYGLWSSIVPTQNTVSCLIYSFSKPLTIFLPYFFSLFFALPFITLGGRALYANGVPALDGGFVQLLATSTGSAALERKSAGACLGGAENMPQELKDLQIRYGELVDKAVQDKSGGLVRRAGFGTKEEIVSLTKGASYGFAK